MLSLPGKPHFNLPVLHGRRLVHIVTMSVGMAIVVYVFHYNSYIKNILQDHVILQHGIRGIFLFLGMATLFCAVGLPRQIVCFAAGLSFGAGYGLFYALFATVIGACLAFLWARWGARIWVRKKLSGSGRLAKKASQIRDFFSTKPFWSILTLRLLPIGSALVVNLLAGVTEIKMAPFIMATILGSLPQTLVFVLLGSGLTIGHTTQLVGGIILFVLSSVLGIVLLAQHKSGKRLSRHSC